MKVNKATALKKFEKAERQYERARHRLISEWDVLLGDKGFVGVAADEVGFVITLQYLNTGDVETVVAGLTKIHKQLNDEQSTNAYLQALAEADKAY